MSEISFTEVGKFANCLGVHWLQGGCVTNIMPFIQYVVFSIPTFILGNIPQVIS